MKCIEENCGREAYVVKRQLCRPHYTKIQRQGPVPPLPIIPKTECVVGECERLGVKSGLCDAHYQQRLAGKPFTVPRMVVGRHPEPMKKTEKWCPRCKLLLAVESFGRASRSSDGLWAYCKECTRHLNREAKHADLSDSWAEDTLRDQGGCGICLSANPKGREWQVDHDHRCCPQRKSCSSCRRGVLCWLCNVALGLFEDKPETIESLATYIREGPTLLSPTSLSEYPRLATESRTEYYRLWKFKLSPVNFNLLLTRQGGGCAGCKRAEGPWHVDHDHTCCRGKASCGLCTRGVLCSKCNIGLGTIQDNLNTLQNMAAYLRKWKV